MKGKKNVVVFILTFSISCICHLLPAHNEEDGIKILCYNILEGMKRDTTHNKSVFAQWIKSQDADIVALQEVNGFKQRQLEDLARSYDHPYAVLLKETGYPVALTSKYPIVGVHKVLDNMHHGFIQAKTGSYNIIVLHLNPHKYWKRREEIKLILETIRQSGNDKNWMIMGDFNSFSPLDAYFYQDNIKLKQMQMAALQYSYHENLINNNTAFDFEVHQAILDSGLKDGVAQYKDFSMEKQKQATGRIDFIYLSSDLAARVIDGGFINDSFTARYSDHRPIYVKLKNAKK